MQLTASQKSTIKAWIIANNSGAFDQSAVTALNTNASPTYKVWRSSLNKHDLVERTDLDSDGTTVTSFAVGGGTGSFIDRSVGERDGWRELFNSTLTCKPFLPNVRIAMFDVFSGAAALSAGNRKHFWARGQRPATVLEKLLAIPTLGGPVHNAANGNSPAGQTGVRGSWTNPDTLGTGTDGNPVEGKITLQEVIDTESAA